MINCDPIYSVVDYDFQSYSMLKYYFLNKENYYRSIDILSFISKNLRLF